MDKNKLEIYLRICENIKEYKNLEFECYNEDEEVFDSNLQCPLAYTTKGDNEEFEIQVTLDLNNNQIIKEISHVYINYKEYECFKDWEEIASKNLNFDDLIMTDMDVDDLLEEIPNKKGIKY